jgi:hypothetical protein
MKNIDGKTIDVHKEELATDEEKFCRMVGEILEMDAVAPKIDKVKINQLFKKGREKTMNMKESIKEAIGKEISVYYRMNVDDEFILTGTLTKHKGDNNYYQVTSYGANKHIVFSESEVYDVELLFNEVDAIILY